MTHGVRSGRTPKPACSRASALGGGMCYGHAAMDIDIRMVGPERHEEFVQPILLALGVVPSPERAERQRRLTELDTRIAALEYFRSI
jgi:hypothetical protein